MSLVSIPHPPADFWQFKLPHILTLLTMVVAVIAFSNRFEHRVSEIESTQKSMLETDIRLTSALERMDVQATLSSQRGIRDGEAVQNNTRRIEALEAIARDMYPKVERLNTNMDWLVKSLQDGGAIKKRDNIP